MTVSVISSDLPFKEGHIRFTAIPLKPFTDHQGKRSQCIFFLHAVNKP